MNKVILKGRLTRDPELKQSQSGKPFCKFGIAVNRYKDGADFFDCTAFNGTADTIAKYLSKGKEILIEGSIQIDRYQDKDGNNRNATSIIVNSFEFCGSRGEDGAASSNTTRDINVAMEEDDVLPF